MKTTMRYIKKPVAVKAYRTLEECDIETLEGTMHANVGDYIITGVEGEVYPCKARIFEKTYEPVLENRPTGSYPETLSELITECNYLVNRYDLFKLGEENVAPYSPDGTAYLAGEWLYGIGMIPAQWVTHVFAKAVGQ